MMRRTWPAIGRAGSDRGEQRPLVGLLDAFLVAFVIFGVADLSLYLVFGDPSMGYVVLLILGLTVAASFARAAAVKGHVEPAIWTMASIISGAAFAFLALRPYLYPLLALGSLLVLAVAMPYISRRKLTILAAASWTASAAILVVGSRMAPLASQAVPAWYSTWIFIAAEAVVIALVMLAILQVGSSLKVALNALERTNGRLRDVDAMKTQFMNTAAHELNTPLTPIKLQLHLLKHHEDGFTENQKRSLEILDRNVGRVTELVHDVLDASRIQGGRLKLRLEDHAVRGAVDEAVASFGHPYEAAGLNLEISCPDDVRVHADARRLTQILFNLLANAMKFTPAGGTVSLTVEEHGDEVEVAVADDGIGLAADEIGRLFRPFSQIDRPETSKAGGTGLGLYICRGIVEEHGGRIWAESRGHGAGATFHFTLPTARSVGTQPQADPQAPGPIREEPSTQGRLDERLRELI